MSLEIIKMEVVEDPSSVFRICCTCLTAHRNLYSLMKTPQVFETFKWMMHEFARYHNSDFPGTWICFECLAEMRKIDTFKGKVLAAQQVLLNFITQDIEATDPIISLSSLSTTSKTGFDKMYVYKDVSPPIYEVMIKDEPDCFDESDIKDPEQGLSENTNIPNYYEPTASSSGAMPTLFIKPMETMTNPTSEIERQQKDDLEWALNCEPSTSTSTVKPQSATANDAKTRKKVGSTQKKRALKCQPSTSASTSTVKPQLTTGSAQTLNDTDVLTSENKSRSIELDKLIAKEMLSYTTEYMSDDIMYASREEAKRNVKYTTKYKCETCLLSFMSVKNLSEHIDCLHTAAPGFECCKICQVYVMSTSMLTHTHRHHLMYKCKVCSHTEYNCKQIRLHIKKHQEDQNIDAKKRVRNKTPNDSKYKGKTKAGLTPYKCGKCDSFFTSLSARQTHITSAHCDKLQCDYCKKLYKNKPLLIAHLRHQHNLRPRSSSVGHNSSRQHVCMLCNVAFPSELSYNKHVTYSSAHAIQQ